MPTIPENIKWKIDSKTYMNWKKVFSNLENKSSASGPDGISDDEWISFLVKERIAPYYYYECNRQGNFANSIILKEALKRYYIHFMAANEIYKREALELLKVLNNEGIIPVLFKGIQLQNEVYFSPELRPTSDLDIVIKNKSQFDKAMTLLNGMGYRKFPYRSDRYARNVLKEIVFLPPESKKINVEIHHSLRFGKWDKRRIYDEVLLNDDNIHIVEANGVKYYGLNDDANYIFLCYHAFQSHINIKSILWINDLFLLKEKLGGNESEVEILSEKTLAVDQYKFGNYLLNEIKHGINPRLIYVDDSRSVEDMSSSKVYLEFKNIDGNIRKMIWIMWWLMPNYFYLKQKYGVNRSIAYIYKRHFTGIIKGLVRIGHLNE
jgi:hypothetical protein